MAKTDANPPLPSFPGEYVLQEVTPEDLQKAVKPKQFIHIDQSECIMCEGCVDICPWKCIHMLTPDTVAEAVNTAEPGIDPEDHVSSSSTRTCARVAPCVSTAARRACSSSARRVRRRVTATRTNATATTAMPTG